MVFADPEKIRRRVAEERQRKAAAGTRGDEAAAEAEAWEAEVGGGEDVNQGALGSPEPEAGKGVHEHSPAARGAKSGGEARFCSVP